MGIFPRPPSDHKGIDVHLSQRIEMNWSLSALKGRNVPFHSFLFCLTQLLLLSVFFYFLIRLSNMSYEPHTHQTHTASYLSLRNLLSSFRLLFSSSLSLIHILHDILTWSSPLWCKVSISSSSSCHSLSLHDALPIYEREDFLLWEQINFNSFLSFEGDGLQFLCGPTVDGGKSPHPTIGPHTLTTLTHWFSIHL